MYCMYGNFCMITSMCVYIHCMTCIISSRCEFCDVFSLVDQEDAKRDREDYILTLDEMYANDFPSPTCVDKDTPQTECNGLYFPELHS